jgi:hypothetical protein
MERDGAIPREALEERMMAYQVQVDQQAREEVAAEIERWKDTELQEMRQAEAAAHRRELDICRAQWDKTYQDALAELKRREEESSTRLRRKEQEVETARFEQRQRILEDMERLRYARRPRRAMRLPTDFPIALQSPRARSEARGRAGCAES